MNTSVLNKHLLLVDGQFAQVSGDFFTGEIRIALLSETKKLIKYQHHSAERSPLCGNIYSGRVVKKYPSLKVAFVDIGLPDQHGFVSNYKTSNDKAIFQLIKDPKGGKCPTLTTNISVTGRYVTLHPHADPSKSQIQTNYPIQINIRENVKNACYEDIKRDADHLCEMWALMKEKAANSDKPRLLYRDSDPIVQAIRNMPYAGQVIVEGKKIYDKIAEISHSFAPDLRTSNHKSKKSLFQVYGVEKKINSLHLQTVPLEKGGSIVINQTEAMTTVDVNSGNSKSSPFNINLSAASVISEQIILRNLSGLFVIDFIHMDDPAQKTALYEEMKLLMQETDTITKVAQLAESGTMEITRQRFTPSVSENISRICPSCQGVGTVLSVSCSAFHLLRDLRDLICETQATNFLVTAPEETVCYILNNGTEYLRFLQSKFPGIKIKVEVGAKSVEAL